VNRGPAGVLSAATSPLGRDDLHFVVFCFATPEDAEALAERRLDVWKVGSVQPKPGQVRPPQLRKFEP
jgi:hypothetical protein